MYSFLKAFLVLMKLLSLFQFYAPTKPNYYFLAHLQCSLISACKFIQWYSRPVY